MPVPAITTELIGAEDLSAILVLNNAHAPEVGEISTARLRSLHEMAFYARRVGEADAFLIGFDQNAAYDSWNFLWLRERLPRFAYVDRIVVAPQVRGKGMAKALYADLYRVARAAGHETIACEVNIDPPNPISDAFHAREGFTEIGRALNPQSRKTVRYLTRPLGRAP